MLSYGIDDICANISYIVIILFFIEIFLYLPSSNNFLLNKVSCNVVILIRMKEERDLSNFSDFKLLIL